MVEGHPSRMRQSETELFHLFVPSQETGGTNTEKINFVRSIGVKTMEKTILTAKHITKLFRGMKALDDVGF